MRHVKHRRTLPCLIPIRMCRIVDRAAELRYESGGVRDGQLTTPVTEAPMNRSVRWMDRHRATPSPIPSLQVRHRVTHHDGRPRRNAWWAAFSSQQEAVRLLTCATEALGKLSTQLPMVRTDGSQELPKLRTGRVGVELCDVSSMGGGPMYDRYNGRLHASPAAWGVSECFRTRSTQLHR
jgi:hypothetical protein